MAENKNNKPDPAKQNTADEPNRTPAQRFIGAFLGVAAGVLSVVASTIRSLFFSDGQQMDIAEVYKRSYERTLNRVMKAMDRDKDEKEEAGKEKGEKEQEGKEQDGKEQDKKDGRFSKFETHDPADRDEKPDISDGLINEATEQMLGDKEIREVLRKLDLNAGAIKESKDIQLFHSFTKNGAYIKENVGSIPKRDFLLGNAKTLAVVLYGSAKGKDASDRMKTECALRACAALGAARYLANKKTFAERCSNGEPMVLASASIKTAHGAERIEIKGNEKYPNTVNFCLDGKPIAMMPIKDLVNSSFDQYKDKLDKYYHKEDKSKNFYVTVDDKSIQFSRNKQGDARISIRSADRTEREKEKPNVFTQKCASEGDVRAFAEKLKEQMGDTKCDLTALAYTISIVVNPDMAPAVTKDGSVHNPLTGVLDPPDKSTAHLVLNHSERGVELSMMYPESEKEVTMIPVNSYHSDKDLTNKDVWALYRSVSEAKRFMEENTIAAVNYDRKAEIDREKDDFSIPIVSAPSEAKSEELGIKKEDLGLKKEEPDLKKEESDPKKDALEEAKKEIFGEPAREEEPVDTVVFDYESAFEEYNRMRDEQDAKQDDLLHFDDPVTQERYLASLHSDDPVPEEWIQPNAPFDDEYTL